MTMEHDRSVVVTGVASGIGRAIYERLVADGRQVVGIDVNADAESLGCANGQIVIGDVADRDVLEAAAAKAEVRAPLTGWVNNAGVAIAGNLHEPDPLEVERVFAVNLQAVFWGASTAIRTLIANKRSGSIVNISSVHGRSAFTGWAAYDTAKGGVDALTRYIAVEYGPVGIRANAIAPGAIRTPMLSQVIAEADEPIRAEREMAEVHPLERLGEPEEIAAVVAFLLGSESSFVSGESIAVDGGATARCFRYDPDPDLLSGYGR